MADIQSARACGADAIGTGSSSGGNTANGLGLEVVSGENSFKRVIGPREP